MRNTSSVALLTLGFIFLLSLAKATEPFVVEGLIIPRDNEGMYVRNPNGQFEIKWTDKTQVALEVNTRLFKGLKEGTLDYQVHSSKEIIRFKLPKGPVTGVVGVRNKAQLEKKLKDELEQKQEALLKMQEQSRTQEKLLKEQS